jgi:hypothetical protein
MLLFAKQYDEALKIANTLLTKEPRNGTFQYLQAQVLTARLADQSPKDEVAAAREAWGKLLADQSLRTRAAERYWEARYQWLTLMLREGDAAQVEKAIDQERVWYPDLGGAASKEKLEELMRKARVAQGLPAEKEAATSGPATQPAEKAPAGADGAALPPPAVEHK